MLRFLLGAMKPFVLIVVAGLAFPCLAEIRDERPRLLSAGTIARLQSGASQSGSPFQKLKQFIDKNTGLGLSRVHGAALVSVVEPAYCAIAAKAAMESVAYLGEPYRVVKATDTKPVTLTFDRPHGWPAGSTVPRIVLSFFSEGWSSIRGLRAVTVVDEYSVSVPWDGTKAGAYTEGGVAFKTFSSVRDFGLNSLREQWWRIALAYDVCRGQLSADDAATLRLYLHSVLEYTVETSALKYDESAEMLLGNLGAGRLMSILKIAAALHGDMNVDREWQYARRLLNQLTAVLDKGVGKGGALTEGAQYAPHTYWYIMEALDTFAAATGEDAWDSVPDWLMEVLEYTIQVTSPVPGGRTQQFQPMPFGDIEQPETFTWSYRRFMLSLRARLNSSGADLNASRAGDWLERVKPNYFGSADFGEYWFYDALYDVPASAPVPYFASSGAARSATTQAYLASGMGQLLLRSSNTWSSFNCGPQGGLIHVHADCGQFQIWRNGTWLTKEQTGYSYHHAGPVSHNILLLNGRGSAFWLNGGTAEEQGAISRMWKSPEYVYAQANMGGVYKHRAPTKIIDSAVRDFFYIPPDTWIIRDSARFKPQQPRIASFIINSDLEPTVQERRVVIQADDGQRLYVDVVNPENPRITVRSHANQYLTAVEQAVKPILMTSTVSQASTLTIEGATGPWAILNGVHKVTKVASDSMAFQAPELDTSKITEPFVGQNAIIGSNASAKATGFWTEITSGVASNSHEHLIVLRASNGNDLAPLPSMPIEGKGAYGVALGNRLFAFVFGETARYTYPARTRLMHIISGLSPSTDYGCKDHEGEISIYVGTGCRTNSAGQLVITTGKLTGCSGYKDSNRLLCWPQ